MTRAAIAQKYRPSVGAVLVIVNLVILLLPLVSIGFFRIYENQLVHETEAELIAQAAVLSAAYKQGIRQAIPDHEHYGKALPDQGGEGRTAIRTDQVIDDGPLSPVVPQIDLASDPIRPPRPDAVKAIQPPDPTVMEIGRGMTALFLDAQRATLAGMRLLDHQGVVVAGRGELGQSLAHVEEVQDALDGRHKSVVRQRISDEPAPPLTSISRGTGIRIFVAYPVVAGKRLWGVLHMSRTPKNIFYHMYDERYRLLAIGAVIIALTLLIARVTSRTLLRPIRSLSNQARELARGKRPLIEPLDHYGTRELAMLGQSFVEMAKALDRRGQYVRDFATHVSHEFKTPLTSIRGASELLGEHHDTMNDDERGRFLDNIEANAARLKALVDRLLDLGRADNIQPFDETIDLVAAVEGLAKEFASVEAVIRVARPCMLQISTESLRMIACNLIQNAVQANATHIDIIVGRSQSGVDVLFRDNGDGVSPGNRDKIYQPFFTTRRESGGTGLGLGIVRSLIAAHNGTIQLTTTEEGTTFALHFQVP